MRVVQENPEIRRDGCSAPKEVVKARRPSTRRVRALGRLGELARIAYEYQILCRSPNGADVG